MARRNTTNVDTMRLIQAMDKTAAIALNSDGCFFLKTRLRVKINATIQMATMSSVEEVNDLLPTVLDELQNHSELLVETPRLYLYYRWNGSCFELTHVKTLEDTKSAEDIYV